MSKYEFEIIPMADVIAAYQPGEGRHWFDPDAMRFFKCKLPEIAYKGPGGTFFVSSDKGPSEVRLSSVRQLVGPGEIVTRGRFNSYSHSRAVTLAKTLASMGYDHTG